MNEEFVKFLKKHEAYEKFMKNLYDEKCGGLCEDCSDISDAFMWAGTPERYKYWSKLNTEWNEINNSSSDSK